MRFLYVLMLWLLGNLALAQTQLPVNKLTVAGPAAGVSNALIHLLNSDYLDIGLKLELYQLLRCPLWHGHEMLFAFAGAATAGFVYAKTRWSGRLCRAAGRPGMWLASGAATKDFN